MPILKKPLNQHHWLMYLLAWLCPPFAVTKTEGYETIDLIINLALIFVYFPAVCHALVCVYHRAPKEWQPRGNTYEPGSDIPNEAYMVDPFPPPEQPIALSDLSGSPRQPTDTFAPDDQQQLLPSLPVGHLSRREAFRITNPTTQLGPSTSPPSQHGSFGNRGNSPSAWTTPDLEQGYFGRSPSFGPGRQDQLQTPYSSPRSPARVYRPEDSPSNVTGQYHPFSPGLSGAPKDKSPPPYTAQTGPKQNKLNTVTGLGLDFQVPRSPEAHNDGPKRLYISNPDVAPEPLKPQQPDQLSPGGKGKQPYRPLPTPPIFPSPPKEPSRPLPPIPGQATERRPSPEEAEEMIAAGIDPRKSFISEWEAVPAPKTEAPISDIPPQGEPNISRPASGITRQRPSRKPSPPDITAPVGKPAPPKWSQTQYIKDYDREEAKRKREDEKRRKQKEAEMRDEERRDGVEAKRRAEEENRKLTKAKMGAERTER
ncbi:uncharacterized protein L201_006582 [Kwoniella dendrophila CBS 6074]|uniref:Stress response RCI peptide n=1 Tax=Kwoniella dendrophila CBS 6074 TaxID=1295534 RepID=A0AAX4K1N7_9TREE